MTQRDAQGSRRTWERVDRHFETQADDPVKGVVRRQGGAWEDTSAPGVRVKILHECAARDERTALYQMDPGTTYPSHIHGGDEECYVLSGDLSVGDELEMGRGDYQRVPGESTHGVQRTREGCLLFIRCSMSDRLTPP